MWNFGEQKNKIHFAVYVIRSDTLGAILAEFSIFRDLIHGLLWFIKRFAIKKIDSVAGQWSFRLWYRCAAQLFMAQMLWCTQ